MKTDHVSSEPPVHLTTLTTEPRLLRIEEVAERLAISRSMAWKLIAIGQLKSLRIGRAVRVRPADLESFMSGAEREL